MKNLFKKIYTKKMDYLFGQSIYPIAKRIRYIKFTKKPRFVKIETTNFCNSLCLYCPHKNLKRKKGIMNDLLFNHIISEVIKSSIKIVHLTNFGESLLDIKLFDRINYIKTLDNSIRVLIITNGFLLNKENISKILNSKLDEIQISFDGFSKENYEKYRIPFKYNDILNKITDLVSERNKLNKNLKITLNSIYNPKEISDEEIAMFKHNWQNKVDKINLEKLHNWSNSESKYSLKINKVNCRDIFLYMTILWDGRIVPCCLDFEGQNVLGNISHESLLNIWFGEKYNEFRKNVLYNKLNMIPCKNCTYMYSSERIYYSSLFGL